MPVPLILFIFAFSYPLVPNSFIAAAIIFSLVSLVYSSCFIVSPLNIDYKVYYTLLTQKAIFMILFSEKFLGCILY